MELHQKICMKYGGENTSKLYIRNLRQSNMKYNVYQSKQKCKIFSVMQCLRLGFFSSSEILGVKRNGQENNIILILKQDKTFRCFKLRNRKRSSRNWHSSLTVQGHCFSTPNVKSKLRIGLCFLSWESSNSTEKHSFLTCRSLFLLNGKAFTLHRHSLRASGGRLGSKKEEWWNGQC